MTYQSTIGGELELINGTTNEEHKQGFVANIASEVLNSLNGDSRYNNHQFTPEQSAQANLIERELYRKDLNKLKCAE